jgi:hypothetical protein
MPPLAKHKKYGAKDTRKKHGWMVVGFDTSMSSISGAAFGYDAITQKLKGPVFSTVRWNSPEHEYFDRIKAASMSHQIIWTLQGHLIMPMLELEEIFIAQEEPWPMGMSLGKTSGFLKQQAEISGAFLGGLIRWGYTNVAQINTTRWRMMVAEDLEITIHHTKWKSPELALKYNCRPADSGKFRSKQWAMNPGYAFMGAFPNEIPDFPDIIERKGGKTPRPEGSKAKAVQPADEYDALAVAWTFFLELSQTGAISGGLA